MDSTRLDTPGKIDPIPIRMVKICRARITNLLRRKSRSESRNRAAAAPETVGKNLRMLPSFEKVKGDKVLYAHASRFCTTKLTQAAPAH